MIEIIVLKATLLLLLTWTLALALRNRSAATRHFVWCAGLFGCAGLLLATLLPPVKVPVWTAATSVAALPPVADAPAPALPVRAATRVAALQTTTSPRPYVYLAGLALVLAWTLAGHVLLARIALRAKRADGHHLSDDISAPVTWGSMILLPSAASAWPAERREAALLHERAHIARKDFLVQIAARLVCAVFWFHPLVWVALRRLRMESEHACDDRVLAAGMVPADYASHLLAVAHGALTRRHGAAAALAMARPSQFESRLLSVLDDNRSHGRVSRNIAAAAALLAGIVILPVAFATTPPAQKSATTREVAASPGETLTLDLKTGASIDITGWDEPRLTVDATMGGRDGANSVVNVTRASNGVKITSEYRGDRDNYSTSIRLAIRAPRRYNMEIQSAGGNVKITDLEGSFRGTSGGGQIVIDRARGEAELSIGGGDILVTDSHLSGDITTGGGKVRLRRVSGGLNASSGAGEVIDEDDDADGTVDGMRVSKAGGPIRIGAHTGDVEATTGGGDVTIGPIAGSVSAATGGGDIDVTVIDANGKRQVVDVASGAGRVTIALPASFDGRVEIESAFTERHGATRIVSDWNLEQSTTQNWDAREGTPRRYQRARGVIGSGQGLVRVKTINGDVVLRRSAK